VFPLLTIQLALYASSTAFPLLWRLCIAGTYYLPCTAESLFCSTFRATPFRMSRNMSHPAMRRHSDPNPRTSASLAQNTSSSLSVHQLIMDTSGLNLDATLRGHDYAQTVNASVITSPTGASSANSTSSTSTSNITFTTNGTPTAINIRNKTDVPEWWPNNIPPYYVIVRDVGLGLRGEAFYWLVHGYHVSDHLWRQLTVRDLEDEVDPERRMDPGMVRRTLWNSMPGNFWMHTSGSPSQPGMDPARTGEYLLQGSSGTVTDTAPLGINYQFIQGNTGPIAANTHSSSPTFPPAMLISPTWTVASALPRLKWPLFLHRLHPGPSLPAMSTWSGAGGLTSDWVSGEFWMSP